MAVTIQTRRDDSVDWTTANPVLALGEIGIETDTDKAKYGDGFTAWNDLEYWIGGDPLPDGTNGQVLRYGTSWEATSDLVVDDAGVTTATSLVATTADINAGTVDAVIGGTTPAAGTFTTFTSTGIDDNATSTAITIDASENVGIGNTAPAHRLDVKGYGTATPTIRITDPVNANGAELAYLQFDSTSGRQGYVGSTGSVLKMVADVSTEMAFYVGGSGNERMRIDSSGNLLVGYTTIGTVPDSNNLKVLGNLVAQGVYDSTTALAVNVHVSTDGRMFRSTSSARYKKEVQDATHGLAEVLSLRPVTYLGTGEADTEQRLGGLIAEEVHDAGLAEFVQYNDEGEPDALAYGNMVSVLVKAIQEQQAQIDELRALIGAN